MCKLIWKAGSVDNQRWFGGIQPRLDNFSYVIRPLGFQGAFPNDRYAQADFDEQIRISPVAGDSLTEFLFPEFWSRRRGCCVTTSLMSVPETALDKNGCSPSRQDDVRHAWKASDMETKAKAASMERSAQTYLRARVLATNARHHAGSSGGINDIYHALLPWHWSANLVRPA